MKYRFVFANGVIEYVTEVRSTSIADGVLYLWGNRYLGAAPLIAAVVLANVQTWTKEEDY